MSRDEAVTKDLIETLEDGKEGFAKGAEKLDDTDAPELATTFRHFSAQRSSFATELREVAKIHDYDLRESGSVAGALHRGWMSLTDALSGSDPSGVLKAAEQGEDHAVREYEKALNDDLSPTLRSVVVRQAAEVKAAHDQVRALARSHA